MSHEQVRSLLIFLPMPLVRVVELTGDMAPDIRAIEQADVIVTTPEKWDGISRSWQNRCDQLCDGEVALRRWVVFRANSKMI